MSNTEEIEKIKIRLEKLENKSKYRSYFEEQIIKANLQIARIKKLGCYLKDNGDAYYFSKSEDTKSMINCFQQIINDASLNILIEQTKE